MQRPLAALARETCPAKRGDDGFSSITLLLASVTVVTRVMLVALAPSTGHFGLTTAGWSSRCRPVVLASTFFGMFSVLPG